VTARAAPARPVTRVAVGVLVRADGAVLLADRPAGKPYAGYWEFPGGKIEGGESVEQALARELDEELGVQVRASMPWVAMEYDYPHAYVRLYFRRIHDWSGTPRPVEGQQLRFLLPGQAPPQPLLPAALPAMRWIQLPMVTGYSPGTATSAAETASWLHGVLDRGLRQIVWHEPAIEAGERLAALAAVAALADSYGARLLLDSRDLQAAGAQAAPGQSRYLGPDELRAASARPACSWLGAGVRTRADILRAAGLGCDFAIIDPRPADSAALLSSGQAAALCADAPLPLYLRSGLALEALETAQAIGLHGLAASIA
jgi:8-oxo-dGTP diphosphatase